MAVRATAWELVPAVSGYSVSEYSYANPCQFKFDGFLLLGGCSTTTLFKTFKNNRRHIAYSGNDVNQSSNCPPVDNLLEKYYLSTMYSIEFALGILGNGIVMFGYIFCMKHWTSGSIYLFNLCLSDFAFLCTLPLLVESYAHEIWRYGSILCQGNRYLLHANLYTSILFLTFISIDRYMLMKFPFKEHWMQKRSTAIIISIAIWIVVILEISPILIFIELDQSKLCLSYGSSGVASESLIYSLCLTVTGFLIPLCIMCYFYIKLVHFLRNRNEHIMTSYSLEKPLTLVALAVIVFSVLFTPYHVMRNLRIASRSDFWVLSQCSKITINAIYIISRPLAFLNSVINPVFYFLMGDHFRELLLARFQHFFKTMKSRCFFNRNHVS
ncbi:succinate receptor 1 [Spea bombifrons]|uniref:succinate receptor 1 n=1 Tax=Spea bombifrons TaxID=233779 RepID=UPI00234B116A|nr:succinate receptor 1 [Spea bombifrons]